MSIKGNISYLDDILWLVDILLLNKNLLSKVINKTYSVLLCLELAMDINYKGIQGVAYLVRARVIMTFTGLQSKYFYKLYLYDKEFTFFSFVIYLLQIDAFKMRNSH